MFVILPVTGYQYKSENIDVDTESLGERVEFAHESWQVPPLHQSSEELKNGIQNSADLT